MSAVKIIEAFHYHHGLRIQEIADKTGITPSAVANYLEYGRPEDEPVSCGPPNDRLYKQGVCGGCQIPLFGGDPISREWCGDCRPAK